MDGGTVLSWSAGNAALLELHFRRLGCLLTGQDATPHAFDTQTRVVAARMDQPTALARIAEAFGLNALATDTLLLAALADQRPAVSAPLQAHRLAVGGRATPALIEAVLGDGALAAELPLRQAGLVSLRGEGRLYERGISVAEPVLEALWGRVAWDAALAPLLRPAPVAAGDAGLAHRIGQAWQATGQVIYGDDSGAAGLIARAMQGVGLVRLDVADLPDDAAVRAGLAQVLRRDLILSGQVLMLMADGHGARAWDFCERVGLPMFLCGASLPAHSHLAALRLPDPPAEPDPWVHILGPDLASHADVASVAATFPLTAPQVRRAAGALAAGLAPNLWSAARAEAGMQMGALAQPLTHLAVWDDLILPPAQMDALTQMAGFLRNRRRVNQDWGFAGKSVRGLGMAALFHGASGTGKTTAAEALIARLGGQVPLYRVNVAALVSKYIGETAKNFDQVFRTGAACGAALLFDEAEGLFGKRTGQTRDSNDKHANAELGFLLQCLESYPGIAILTTNMRAAIDEAFFRRFRFVIDFPFPDKALREAIWRRVLPDALPRDDLDFDALARPSLSGGNIRSVAINAAHLAAGEDVPLGMRHLAHAVRLEFSKLEKTPPDRDLQGWGA
jgi:hypothetical protein